MSGINQNNARERRKNETERRAKVKDGAPIRGAVIMAEEKERGDIVGSTIEQKLTAAEVILNNTYPNDKRHEDALLLLVKVCEGRVAQIYLPKETPVMKLPSSENND